MKIKDILEDYSIHPNIPVKHLANDIEKVIGQFKDSLKVGIYSPSQLIYSYCNYFDDIKKSFIRCVLNKEKSKSGIFVSQHNGYSIASAMKDKFDFHISKINQRMRYSLRKLYELTLVEVQLLMLTHGKVYDFQIKYAIIHLLCKHFTFYTQCVYDNSWSVDIFLNGQDDIETVYNMVLDTEVSALPQIDKEFILDLHCKQTERITPKSINKPRCAEDLTCLYDEEITQAEKKEIIARHYKTSISTAQRWMKRYGLLKASNNKKHEDRVAKEQETEQNIKKLMQNDIYKMISPYAQSIIDVLNSTIKELHETIDKKDEEIESLKEYINKLNKNQQGGVLSGVNDNDDTNWMNVDLKAQGMFG